MNEKCNAPYPFKNDFPVPVHCEKEAGHKGQHFMHWHGGVFEWNDEPPTLGIHVEDTYARSFDNPGPPALGVSVTETVETKDKPG